MKLSVFLTEKICKMYLHFSKRNGIVIAIYFKIENIVRDSCRIALLTI